MPGLVSSQGPFVECPCPTGPTPPNVQKSTTWTGDRKRILATAIPFARVGRVAEGRSQQAQPSVMRQRYVRTFFLLSARWRGTIRHVRLRRLDARQAGGSVFGMSQAERIVMESPKQRAGFKLMKGFALLGAVAGYLLLFAVGGGWCSSSVGAVWGAIIGAALGAWAHTWIKDDLEGPDFPPSPRDPGDW